MNRNYRNRMLVFDPDALHRLMQKKNITDGDLRGAELSKSALQRYGSPFEQRLAQLKMASEQAKALVDSAPDDEDKLGAAVVRLTQEKIFSVLMELDIDPRDIDVNKLFKNAAEIGKASVTQKRLSLEVRAQVEEAARKKLLEEQREKLTALGASGKVDPATLDMVIKAAYGL